MSISKGIALAKRSVELGSWTAADSSYTSLTHLSVVGGVFLVVRYAALVCYSEFRGCPLFGSSKCIASTGIAVGTSTVVCILEEVRSWEGPLSDVPLYVYFAYYIGVCVYRVSGKTYCQNILHMHNILKSIRVHLAPGSTTVKTVYASTHHIMHTASICD